MCFLEKQQIMLVKDGKTREIIQVYAEKLEKFEYQWVLTAFDGFGRL